MSPEEEYALADAVRVECFHHLREMLLNGSDVSGGATFETWAMRHAVAANAQVCAARAMEAERSSCAA